MAKLTIIENGISSDDMVTAINANFAFIASLSALSTSLVTITNAMQGQALLDNINANFNAINLRATTPISPTTISLGITGAALNTLFKDLYEGVGRGMNGLGYFLEYEESTLHLCTTRGDKILAFDGVDTVSLSLDNGKTYPYSKQIVGMEPMICYAYIWLTGEIMFCTDTKAYYSHDNLTTINESAVVGIDGNPWTAPVLYSNFSPLNIGQYHKDDMPYWGAYGSDPNTANGQVNAWYSVDKGVTIKSWFKTGVSLGLQASNHIHNINYDIISDTFIILLGDDFCRWIRGVYDSLNDTWELTHLKTGDGTTYFKSAGFIWRGDDLYWVVDSNTSAVQGIWTCKYSDILNEENYERIYIHNDDTYCAIGDENEILFADGIKNKISFSFDGVNIYTHVLTSVLAANDQGSLLCFTPKNKEGFYRCELWSVNDQSEGAAIRNMYLGPTMLFKINH